MIDFDKMHFYAWPAVSHSGIRVEGKLILTQNGEIPDRFHGPDVLEELKLRMKRAAWAACYGELMKPLHNARIGYAIVADRFNDPGTREAFDALQKLLRRP